MPSGRFRDLSQYIQIGNFLINENKFLDSLEELATGCIVSRPEIGRHRQGYSMYSIVRISDNKRVMTVGHRIAMMLKLRKELTHDEFVIHTCNNNRCVNPTHLIIGDYYTKDKIMVQKGHVHHRHSLARSNKIPRKQANRKYKYTDQEITWIRNADSRDIAARYNCSRMNASKMRWECRNRYQWLK